ncbi:MAG TPA: hypothetical protein VFN55_06345 [Solirubrobacteraceae bacterium]|nr:hypothetical protein [Solirubrobacteraceae bacterium]
MKKIFLAISIGFVLMIPSLAMANGSSSCQAYQQNCSNNTTSTTPSTGSTTAVTTPTATAATTASQSTLPFTGLDLVALVSGGSVLLGAGLVVRRLSRDSD